MIDAILTAAGVQHRETRYPKPPAGTYAVYMDDVTVDGSDGAEVLTYEHDATIELYTPTPDPASERAVEDAITTAGQLYTKQARYWIQEEQLYQTIYEFTFYTKE